MCTISPGGGHRRPGGTGDTHTPGPSGSTTPPRPPESETPEKGLRGAFPPIFWDPSPRAVAGAGGSGVTPSTTAAGHVLLNSSVAGLQPVIMVGFGGRGMGTPPRCRGAGGHGVKPGL